MMSQANVSRGKAIKALKNNQNDIVNAIMVSKNYYSFMLCNTYRLPGMQKQCTELFPFDQESFYICVYREYLLSHP